MEAFKERLIKEHKFLEVKLNRLHKVIYEDKDPEIKFGKNQLKLMRNQYNAMYEYHRILGLRIKDLILEEYDKSKED